MLCATRLAPGALITYTPHTSREGLAHPRTIERFGISGTSVFGEPEIPPEPLLFSRMKELNVRNLLALIGLLVVGGGGAGWYLGWYKLSVTRESDGNLQIKT